jgi:hypothetical protein
MKFVIPLLIPFLFAFKPLSLKFRGHTRKELAKSVDKVKLIQSSIKRVPQKKSKLRIENKKLKGELNRLKAINSFSPSFDNQYGSISTLERFKGVIDGNIKLSGSAVDFKVDFLGSRKIPSGSYLSCVGTGLVNKYNYRILATCDRLITPEGEFQVSVGIKDLKKIDGIRPDYDYTGDEEAVIGEAASAITGNLINAKKERVQTSIGFSDVPTVRNAYIGGLVDAARMANQKAKSHTSNQIVIMAAKDKTEVIIEFKRRFSYEKESKI